MMCLKRKIHTIALVFNLKGSGLSGSGDEEYDEVQTINSLKQEIEKQGFKVIPLEQNRNFLVEIVKLKPDFVFNIAEGIGTARGRESQVPAVLECLGIPYSGSDPISLGITLDKYLTNKFLRQAKIPVPLMFMAKNEEEVKSLTGIFRKKPLFVVKPRWEGSSKGICFNSLVDNYEKLKQRMARIFSEYRQPAVAEEFLEKEEITAAVCGNADSIRLLGMMKISPREGRQKKFLYSLENKKDWQLKIKYEPEQTISPVVSKKVEKYALAAFKSLELRDFARIDFRVDLKNTPKIIDINPLPGLSPHYSDLPILYRLKGGSYSGLVKELLAVSLRRYGYIID